MGAFVKKVVFNVAAELTALAIAEIILKKTQKDCKEGRIFL